ncbi:hypothetical protein PFISCL1PPCAC_21160, partial [Pristionchus fissidentatus]
MLFTSLPTCLLIIVDIDPRSRHYRKYLLSVLIPSILLDIWTFIGVPIFLLNYGIAYCIGHLPLSFGSEIYSTIYSAFLIEICSSYASSAYYRRNVRIYFQNIDEMKII